MSRVIDNHLLDAGKPEGVLVRAVDSPGPGGANHVYDIMVEGAVGGIVHTIRFQHGPIREAGRNGVTEAALLAVLIDRLRSFQQGSHPGPYNARALMHLEEALSAVHDRTRERLERGVEGSSDP